MSENQNNLDASILRGMLGERVSRRQVFGVGAALAGGLTLASGGVAGAALPNAGVGSSTWWKNQAAHDKLHFANWPYYIDTLNGNHPTIDRLESTTGMNVTYTEVIEDNPSFYQRILPSLAAHDNTGYDLMVMTNNSFELSYLIQGGWLIPLDQSKMANFKKYGSPSVKNPAWDKGNKYTMAWQSGWTTVAYNKQAVTNVSGGLDILFDKKYKGKIGMMADPIELGSIGLLAIGVNPATSKPSDWAKAAAKLRKQRDDGIVAAYYGNDYIGHLKNGDLVASQSYSGDIFQANLSGSKNLVLMTPKQGIMFWTDNMCIPLYAANPRDAMIAMDYFYDPKVQSVLEYYIDYACPVPTAKNELLNPTGWNTATLAAMRSEVGLAPSVTASSPQVFPTAAMTKASRTYYQFKNQSEIDTWNGYFLPIVQGA